MARPSSSSATELRAYAHTCAFAETEARASETRPASAEARDGSGETKENGERAGNSQAIRIMTRSPAPARRRAVLPPYIRPGKKNVPAGRCSVLIWLLISAVTGGDVSFRRERRRCTAPADGCDHKLHGGANDRASPLLARVLRVPSGVPASRHELL